MKVCTDACLFGAWVANIVITKSIQHQHVLDIGTGTGLLSLMLAQQLAHSRIEAIEIDEAAATQAAANFAISPWKDRLSVLHTPIQSFIPLSSFDLIISNPPFFQNDLASPDVQRNVALHSHQLSLEALLEAIQKHLTANGHFAILLPFHRTAYFESLAQKGGFYLQQKAVVQQTPSHSPFRGMLLFGRNKTDVEQAIISIKDTTGSYTEAFTALLRDYYLYL